MLSYSSTQDSAPEAHPPLVEMTRCYYTANGDLTLAVKGSDTTRYSYDAFGSLRSVQLADGTLLEYLIDGSGRRVGRKVNGVVTQKWLYSSDLGITAELDSANNIVSRFVYISSENVPEYFTKSGVLYRVVTDHLGSVKQVINAQTGAIVQSIDYDEFGNILVDTNPGFTPFGFAGGVYDNLSKLVRFGARDYDASIGRWTAKDQILFKSEESDLYAYCSTDPNNHADPSGKIGIGLAFSATAEGGFIGGISAQIDLGYGAFWGGPNGFNMGGFVSGGGFVNNPSPKGVPPPSGIFGMSAGYGAGFFMTTANSPSELGGWFDTYSLNTPWISIQYSKGYTVCGRLVEYAQFTIGPTVGASVSNYPTYTFPAGK